MRKIFFIIFLAAGWFLLSVSARIVSAETILPPPPDNLLSFTTLDTGWRITNPESRNLVSLIDQPFSGIVLDCSQGKDVVLEYLLPANYQGEINFDFIEENQANSLQMSYLFSIRNAAEGINFGAKLGLIDQFPYYNSPPTLEGKFFYSSKMTITDTARNSFVNRKNSPQINNLTLAVTPLGAYVKINGINLSYLPSNKDAGNGRIFYPVNYELTSFNKLIVGCPWQNLNNSSEGGRLFVKNPEVVAIQPIPQDRRVVFRQLAFELLKNFPETYPPSLNPRVEAIRALAYAYLYEGDYEEIIKGALNYSLNHIDPNDRGATYSTLALAYWLAVEKYPGILLDENLKNLFVQKMEERATQLAAANPESAFIARSGGDRNAFTGGFLGVVGTMFERNDWLDKAKCFIFHAATKSINETSGKCPNIHTKNLYSGRENLAGEEGYSDYISAINDYLNGATFGQIYDGRLDNHNYGPHPAYIYGGLLGEIMKATIAFGSNKDGNFGGSLVHAITSLYPQNLAFVDFEKNLWNSTTITKIEPKERNILPEKYYDGRNFAGERAANFVNMFKYYSKSDNFLDPANSINGLVMGSLYYKDFTNLDLLLKRIWYTGRDYGVFPWGKQQSEADLTPLISLEQQGNAISKAIFPATSIERYVLSAMLLDPDLRLIPLSQIKPPSRCPFCSDTALPKNWGNANCDGKINGIDFGKWLVVFQNPSASEEEKAQVDFNCQEEQTTHTVDLEDFRIWARNY